MDGLALEVGENPGISLNEGNAGTGFFDFLAVVEGRLEEYDRDALSRGDFGTEIRKRPIELVGTDADQDGRQVLLGRHLGEPAGLQMFFLAAPGFHQGEVGLSRFLRALAGQEGYPAAGPRNAEAEGPSHGPGADNE